MMIRTLRPSSRDPRWSATSPRLDDRIGSPPRASRRLRQPLACTSPPAPTSATSVTPGRDATLDPDAAGPRVDPRSGSANDIARHRDHRASDLLAVQPDPRNARGAPCDRCQCVVRRLFRCAGAGPSTPDPDPADRRGRGTVRPGRGVPTGTASSARAHWPRRVHGLALPERKHGSRAGRRDGRACGVTPVRGRAWGADRARAGYRPRGDRGVGRDDPRRSVGGSASHDLHAQDRSARRSGHHPGIGRSRSRRVAAVDRDDVALRAFRHAPSRGARDHGADRRRRDRCL